MSNPPASIAYPPVPDASLPLTSLSPPPDVAIPAVPGTFQPVKFARFRGYFPKAAQLGALPNALADLESFDDYDAVFGQAAPARSSLVLRLTNAYGWTTLRSRVESFLTYARSMEVAAWKDAIGLVHELDAVHTAVGAKNPRLLAGHDALGALLDATKRIGRKGAATRKRRLAEKKAKEAAP